MVYLFALLSAGDVKTIEQTFEVIVQTWEVTEVDVKGLLTSLISLN